MVLEGGEMDREIDGWGWRVKLWDTAEQQIHMKTGVWKDPAGVKDERLIGKQVNKSVKEEVEEK